MMKRSVLFGLMAGLTVAGAVVVGHGMAFADAAAEATDGHGAMGPHAWIAAALDKLDLRDDQRAALEQLRADVKTQSAPVIVAHQKVAEAVAVSIEAGGVLDRATIDPLVADAVAAAVANRPVVEGAANRLYAILNLDQRQALVSALQASVHAHGFHHPAGADRLAKISGELGLSSEQLATIRARVAGGSSGVPTEMVTAFAHMKRIADAFASDSFDAHALGVGDHAATVGPAMANLILTHLDAALPVLTAEQRTRLAQMIRAQQLTNLT